MENSTLASALKYLSQGISVIPINPHNGGKSPYVSWIEYQKRLPTEQEVRSWWKQYPKAQVAIITGRISNLIVVDIDPRNGGIVSMSDLYLPPTYIVKTGGDGWHYYYRLPNNVSISKKPNYLPGIDIQAEGAYVLSPPSIHPSGKAYETTTEIADIADAPSWLLTNIEKPKEEKLWSKGVRGVIEGSRNETATSYVGKLLSELSPELWEAVAWPAIQLWNQQCIPPLQEKELRDVFKSIATKEEKKRDKNSNTKGKQVDEFLKNTLLEIECFRDELSNPYVRIKVEDHYEIYSCEDRKLLSWVLIRFSEMFERIPSNEEQTRVLGSFEAHALMNKVPHELKSRIARLDGTIYYDLGNPTYSAIGITKDGWNEINTSPIYFRRTGHQLEQVNPKKNTMTAEIFFKYLNVADIEEKKLFLISLIVAFIPDIARPIFVLHGEQGSAKSTLSRFCKKIIDPGELDAVAFPSKEDDLIIQLSRNYAIFYDNISNLNQSFSDVLCRAVTGSSMAKRKLYSDGEEFVIKAQRLIGINGINQIIQRLDLLDRCIIFELEPITEEERLPDSELKENFERELPFLLGSIFSIIQIALQLEKEYKPKKYPRMAEYARWGALVSEALGYGYEFFNQAYEKNREKHSDAVADSPLMIALEVFAKGRRFWDGGMSDLLRELKSLPSKDGWSSNDDRLLPSQPNYLAREINRLKPHLKKTGIYIKKRGARHYQLEYSPSEFPEGTPSSLLTSDDKNDEFPNSGKNADLGY